MRSFWLLPNNKVLKSLIYEISNKTQLTSVLSKTASREQTIEIVNPGHKEAFGLWMTEHAHLELDDDTSRTEKKLWKIFGSTE